MRSNVDNHIWLRVKQVFDLVVEYEPAERKSFLDHACINEPEVRREVESLLESYERSASFMDAPAIQAAAESFAATTSQLENGQRIKQYEIIAPIGRGGMGEVYLAKDTNLSRRVAIKLLPMDFANDSIRLRRFKREARTASGLSHPNVSVIHEVGETDDGRPFIAMEYIEGTTLREQIKKGSLGLDQSLDIAVQIANAITAAHEAGIIHRDIKPENIMIRNDGYVKVLDFGLAKLAERTTESSDSLATSLLADSIPGAVMGTVGYMSPEQARGISVDERTDLWSLGVVLYEMLTGRAPFEGATPTDVVIAIVEREPGPVGHFVRGVPEEIERILRKALRKDPDDRYQLAKEMAIDLRTLRRDVDLDAELERSVPPGSSGNGIESRRTFRNIRGQAVSTKDLGTKQDRSFYKWAVALIALTILLAVGIGVFKLLRREPVPNESAPFDRIRVTKLTTNGSANFAAISPDGRYVAYVMDESGAQSLWLRQVATPSNVQLVPPGPGSYLGIAFSPDGEFLYYGYADSDRNDAGTMYRIPVIGGTPVRLNRHVGPAALSHDRKRIAFIRYDTENQADYLVMANSDETAEQVLATRKWPAKLGWDWDSKPIWGKRDSSLIISAVDVETSGALISLFEIDLKNGVERTIPLSSERFEQLGHVGLLPDGSGVIISAKARGSSFSQIWRLSRDGQLHSITNDLSDYQDSRLTADGSAFVTVQNQTLSNIWLLGRNQSEATQVTTGSGRYYDLSWTPEGKIIYASDASGSADIFEMDATNGRARQLTANSGRNYAPSVSPDGRYIVFHSNRDGRFQIWRIDRDGSNPKQLTFGDSESHWPQVTIEGKWVIFQQFKAGAEHTVWKVSIDGGEPVPVLSGNAIRASVSPDGKWVATWQNDGQPNSRWQLSITPLTETGSARIFEVEPSVQVRWDKVLRWTGDSLSVTYVDSRGGVDNLWAQNIAGGKPRQVTHFKDNQIFSFGWSQDGKLIASRGVITSDVVLIADESD